MVSTVERLLRLKQVKEKVPYSTSTIYEMVATGRFPKPYKIGSRAVAWASNEIDDWIMSRVESQNIGGNHG